MFAAVLAGCVMTTRAKAERVAGAPHQIVFITCLINRLKFRKPGMSAEQIEEAIKTTFLDHRLTRGERKGLSQVIEQCTGDEQAIAVARSYAFDLAREQISGPEGAAAIDWLEDVMKVLAPMHVGQHGEDHPEAFFSPVDPCVNKIVRLFTHARKQVDICVYTITDDRIRRAIEDAYQRRVKIRVVSDDDKADDPGSDIASLRSLGIPVRVDQTDFQMHHKFALFDERQLLTGSYNWTRSAAEHNQENFLVTTDHSLVASYRKAFDRMWRDYE